MSATVPVPVAASSVPPAPPRTRSRRRIAVTSGVVVLLVVAIGFWWWDSHRKGVTFTAMFTSSVGVYPGSDVRILGVPVGTVDSVTPKGKEVELGMHLDPGRSVGADTAAVIVSPNLVSDRYVQLTSPWVSGPKLRDGARIKVTRTPVELDTLYRSLLSLSKALGPTGANSQGALSQLLVTGAANLDGNGKNLNTALTQLSSASRTLSNSKDGIFDTIDNLRTFTGVLEKNDSRLRTVNNELASVSQTFANDRNSFAEAVKELGTALSLVQTFIKDNRAALSANVGKLNTVAGTLAGQRTSLLKALAGAPLLVQNFIKAYDPTNNLIRGRVNLNELTVFAKQQAAAANVSGSASGASVSGASASAGSASAGSGSASAGSASGSDATPAGLLPAANVPTGGGR